jgi:hypothetical protein
MAVMFHLSIPTIGDGVSCVGKIRRDNDRFATLNRSGRIGALQTLLFIAVVDDNNIRYIVGGFNWRVSALPISHLPLILLQNLLEPRHRDTDLVSDTLKDDTFFSCPSSRSKSLPSRKNRLNSLCSGSADSGRVSMTAPREY